MVVFPTITVTSSTTKGFEAKVQERQEAKRAAAAARAKSNWGNAIGLAIRQPGSSAVAAFGGSGKHATHFKKYVAQKEVKGDTSWQGGLYNFIHGHTRSGKYAEYCIIALIVANVAAFMAGTTESGEPRYSNA